MSVISRQKILLKTSVVFGTAIFAIFGFQKISVKYETVSASASGPTASHTNAPGENNCAACHSTNPVNTGGGSIKISDLPANYLPNQQIPITVTTARDGGVVFGFQLTAVDSQGKRVGTFTLPTQTPAQMQIVNGIVGGNQRSYIEHTVNGITPTVFDTKSWTFMWTAPAQRAGKVSFYAAGNAANGDGVTGGDFIYTTDKSTLTGTAISNFDADGKSDVAVFRPSTGYWYSQNSTNGSLQAFPFGISGDRTVAADYDGDGKTDFAVFRPSNGAWYIQKSSSGFTGVSFGQNGDVPVVGDYDGDLKSDVAVFRPSTGSWYISNSSNGAFVAVPFGIASDKVAQGDYDGDGKTDVAVYRPAQGAWYVNRSRDGFFGTVFGEANDKPVQGDYDGDGRTDIAVYRPASGAWFAQRSRDGFYGAAFGISTDKPVPADYDGDGKTDIAVLRDTVWYILKSSDGSYYGVYFGSTGDVPVPGGYIAQ